jgi:catechol 2,3-dioxygenase-like lactoylglutathione lyase family enzyme
MRRVFLLYAALSLCFIAFVLGAEERPLATRVEHFFVVSDQAQSLFTYFKETFQLPEVWPYNQRGMFSSGGLSFGNAVLEIASFLKEDNKPLKTEFKGIAFEPQASADATAAELAKRNIAHTDVRSSKYQMAGELVQVGWSNVALTDFPPTSAHIFFCDYKDRQAVAQRRKAASDELARRMGGPLGIVAVAEITVGVQDLDEARSKWSALLEPSPQISDDAFVFSAGPRIHLVRAESPSIQGIVLIVRSIGEAEKFLKERRLLAKDNAGHIAISPAAIEGLAIRLTDVTQVQKPAHPLLGHGRGIDHVGIGVRDLEKAINDYEQVLGFKCIANPPPRLSGALGRIIFFEDETLLEFLSPPQPASAVNSDYLRYLAAFAEKHEGAISLALETSSAKAAADYLKAHNFEIKLSEWPRVMKEGETKPLPAQYYSVSNPDTPSGNKQIFMLWIWLIEHASPERPAKIAARREQSMMAHPNTALRIRTVWFAVRDLDAQLQNLHDAGFESGETREAKFLGAKGREVKAGQGSLLLLESAAKNGALSNFLLNHDDGQIIGISIEVSDLKKARSLVEGHSGHKLEPYNGFYGQSIMIPPDLTHGVWMELFQR